MSGMQMIAPWSFERRGCLEEAETSLEADVVGYL